MQRPSRTRVRGRTRSDRTALLHQFGGAETAAEIETRVPLMEPKAGICLVLGGGSAGFHSPAAAWGERPDTWHHTCHHPYHFPAGTRHPLYSLLCSQRTRVRFLPHPALHGRPPRCYSRSSTCRRIR